MTPYSLFHRRFWKGRDLCKQYITLCLKFSLWNTWSLICRERHSVVDDGYTTIQTYKYLCDLLNAFFLSKRVRNEERSTLTLLCSVLYHLCFVALLQLLLFETTNNSKTSHTSTLSPLKTLLKPSKHNFASCFLLYRWRLQEDAGSATVYRQPWCSIVYVQAPPFCSTRSLMHFLSPRVSLLLKCVLRSYVISAENVSIGEHTYKTLQNVRRFLTSVATISFMYTLVQLQTWLDFTYVRFLINICQP